MTNPMCPSVVKQNVCEMDQFYRHVASYYKKGDEYKICMDCMVLHLLPYTFVKCIYTVAVPLNIFDGENKVMEKFCNIYTVELYTVTYSTTVGQSLRPSLIGKIRGTPHLPTPFPPSKKQNNSK